MNIQPGQANKPKKGSRSPQRRPKAARPIHNGPEPGQLDWNRLSPADRVFIEAYTDIEADTWSNATRSYLKAHPGVTYYTANSNGTDTAKRLALYIGDAQPSKDTLFRRNELVFTLAQRAGDLARMESVTEKQAKLAQYLVDKVETREISSDDRSALTDLARSSIEPSN